MLFAGVGEMKMRTLVFGCVLLSFLNNVYSGITSSFIRSEYPAVDMPLDNEVFAIPDGYNAPQQVT